jgi:PAS domain S-box-containing protein
MNKRLRVLVVDDSEDDTELVLRELHRGGYDVAHRRVETAETMRAALSQRSWDIVISDYTLPGFDAPAAISVLTESGQDIPILVVSGTIGEDTAVEALKAGAADFMVKGRLARFLASIERELRVAETRRKSRGAEEAARESEVKYRRIVETAQEGIWVLDASDRTTYVNQRMADMLASTPAQLVGRSLFDFMDDEWKQIAIRKLGRQRPGPAESHEFKFRRANGSEFWGSLSTSPVADDVGQDTGALAMVADITEQRKLKNQLMVSDRLASVGTLAAGVAHEINNPLASVIANLELALPHLDWLQTKVGDAEPLRSLREQINDARESAKRVQGTVKDLKIFARAQEDKRENVDVRLVLDSAVRLSWNEIRHRAKLVKSYGAVPPVDASESRLGQVFLNLIVNAAQAIPEGKADQNEIRLVTTVGTDGDVVIEVHDTGHGMSPEVIERLFTPFFTTKPVGFGTGLGLSICHRIVSSLGGQITVESKPGRGTMFRVSLPAARRQVSLITPPPAAASAPPPRRGRVLVIDDEPMMAKVLHRTLATDHDVVAVLAAKDALAMIAAGQRFTVILCDLMMPHVTGMDLYAELLRSAPEQAKRIIFLTGGAFTSRMRAFLDEVDNLCLEKPFDPAGLRTLISARVNEDQSENQSENQSERGVAEPV